MSTRDSRPLLGVAAVATLALAVVTLTVIRPTPEEIVAPGAGG